MQRDLLQPRIRRRSDAKARRTATATASTAAATTTVAAFAAHAQHRQPARVPRLSKHHRRALQRVAARRRAVSRHRQQQLVDRIGHANVATRQHSHVARPRHAAAAPQLPSQLAALAQCFGDGGARRRARPREGSK
eukprot:7279314-Prymnesium_polylepis.5